MAISGVIEKEMFNILKVFRAGQPVEPLVREPVSGKHEATGGQFVDGYRKMNSGTIETRSIIQIKGRKNE